MSELQKPAQIRLVLAANLRAERARKNLTQAQVAELANVPQQTLSDAEHARRSVGIDIVGRICRGLGISYAAAFREPE